MKYFYDEFKLAKHNFLIIADETGLQFISLTDAGWTEYQTLNPKSLEVDEFDHRPALIKPYKKALQAFFNGHNRLSSLPISSKLPGTDFQKLVWQALHDLKGTSTITYAELAAQIGHPNSSRAVASAVAKNPVGIVIPCHRALPKSGGLGQYRGGRAFKQDLLHRQQTATV